MIFPLNIALTYERISNRYILEWARGDYEACRLTSGVLKFIAKAYSEAKRGNNEIATDLCAKALAIFEEAA